MSTKTLISYVSTIIWVALSSHTSPEFLRKVILNPIMIGLKEFFRNTRTSRRPKHICQTSLINLLPRHSDKLTDNDDSTPLRASTNYDIFRYKRSIFYFLVNPAAKGIEIWFRSSISTKLVLNARRVTFSKIQLGS